VIDFRFHLVSIVSIFLALAVGIVLGAGPLQGNIGNSLTDQLSQLRQEKEALRTQLNDATKTITAEDQYAGLVAPAALAGQLKDASVVLVVSPDASGKFAQQVQQALKQGGASVTTTVTLKDEYRDPALATERGTAAKKAATLLGLGPGTDGDALLAEVLAKVLVHPRLGEKEPIASGAAALAEIKDAGLIDFTQSTLRRADYAVILHGPIAGSSASVTAQSTTLLRLASALDSDSSGVVVATGQPATSIGQEETTSLVTVVRKDAQASKAISTVDHADTVMGAGIIVLGLARQNLGETGHFGISSDAQSAVPPAP
jgi:hypothetical protein